MKTIKVGHSAEIPKGYTGIVEYESEDKTWFKNGKLHREDGPAYTRSDDGHKFWWLDGKLIWNSNKKLDLRNKIILSKTKHPEYPTIQVWKILNKNKVYELTVIPGMEECIIE